MRLHSEKTARELALRKRSEQGGEDTVAAHEPSRAAEGHGAVESATGESATGETATASDTAL